MAASRTIVHHISRLARSQSSIAKAWKEFDEDGRMKASDFRDRVVDVMEELMRFTLLLRPHADRLVDRYSERCDYLSQQSEALAKLGTEK